MKILKSLYLGLLSTFFTLNSFATPQSKGTDIILLDLKSENNKITVSKPLNITNREGYDNQPSFLPDGKSLFYVSMKEDKQADIYKYDLQTGKTEKVTDTKEESEYSPTVMFNKETFSTVRVEKDGTQRLWQFNLNGSEPKLVIENLLQVGYHGWINKDTVALFILGEFFTLQIYNTSTGKLDIVEKNIGRCLKKIPNKNALSFLHKVSEKKWVIKELNLDNFKTSEIITALPKSEDFAWTPDGTLIMGNKTKLFKYNPSKDKAWSEFADLKKEEVGDILRIDVNAQNNKIAIVSSKE